MAAAALVAPAHASLADVARGLAPAQGPVTVTYPGGDVVVSMDDAGADPATVMQAYSTLLPASLGIASNSSLSDLIQALYQKMSGATPGLSAPPAFSGGSVSVSGSTITIDVPAADVPVGSSTLPGALAGFIGALIGAIAAVVVFTICVGALGAAGFAATGPAAAFWVTPLCSAISWFFWSFVGLIINDVLGGTPLDTDQWTKILVYSFTNSVLGLFYPFVSAWIVTRAAPLFASIGTAVKNAISGLRSWFGAETPAVAAAAAAPLADAGAAAPAELPAVAAQAGLASVAGSGTVTSGISGDCMDAYGSSGDASNGQIAAINVCNGNPAQNWTIWSNDNMTVWGLCLDTADEGTAVGTLVQLWTCDGAASQVWRQVGDSLVNPNSGLCLDDPNATNVNGTQLRIWTCNGSAAQQWNLPSSNQRPSNGSSCDLYAFYGTPCVAAYSTVRALYSNYGGPLYEVQRASDGTTANIGLLSPGWYVDAGQQDSFCAGTTCTITKLFDQSPQGNNLTIAADDQGASATALPVTIHGNKAYGVFITPGTGYRNNSTRGIAVNGQPEGMYMVASGTHVNAGCCFDFGNVETNRNDNGAGHMDAVNLTTACLFPPCTGSGPWVQADLENGQFMGNGPNPNNLGNSTPFVTAMLKNDGQTTFALKGADATTGFLSQWYEGPLPAGYAPMHQEGAIVMGTGGDNSHAGVGSFFEGVMTAGYPSPAADDAVQANIVPAGYAGNSGGPPGGGGLAPPAGTITMPGGKCVDVQGNNNGGNLAPVQVWDCLPDAVDQHWTHNADLTLETLGRCLSISTAVGVAGSGQGAPGEHTTLWDCNGSGVEKWLQQPDGTLRNPPSGLCLDDPAGNTANGWQLQVQPCVPGDQAQQFAVNGGNTIIHIASGKCVDVQGDDVGSNLTPAQVWDCLPNAADQHWIYDPGSQTLKTLGRCLGISVAIGVGGSGTASPGNHTVLFDCNGSGVEKWVQQPDGTLINPPSGLCLYGQSANGYQLQSVPCNPTDPNQQLFAYDGGGSSGGGGLGTITLPGGKCADVLGDETGTDGTPVDVWDCLPGAADQRWTHNADGSLEAIGRCLSVSVAPGVAGTGLASDGDHITLWTCNGSGVEKWMQQPDGTLINPPSGLCLDDPAGNTANGWQLQVSRCMGGDPTEQFAVNGGNPITDLASGKCIDVQGNDNGINGAPVQLWDCLPGAADQHWVYNPSSQTLKTLGRCLTVSVASGVGGTGTAAPGNHTVLWDCNGSGVEKWVPRPDGTLMNPPSGLCLDDPGGNTANGWQLQAWQCINGDPNQQFAVYDPGVVFVNPVSGKCVDVVGDDNGGNGTPVDLWDCQPTAADQHWIHTSAAELETLGRCLSVSTAQGVGGTGQGVPGNRVVLWDCNGSSAEVWAQRADGTWVNPDSRLCLDDPGGSTSNGTQLQVWTCPAPEPGSTGKPNQVFAFRP
jgi:hypothetical protein